MTERKRRYLTYILIAVAVAAVIVLLSVDFGRNPAANLRTANVLLDEGFLEEALLEYERALEGDPTNLEAAVGRLDALDGTHQLRAARDRFIAARDAHPGDPFYSFQLALYYAHHLDFHRAQEQLEQAAANGLDRGWNAYGTGVIYNASGQFANAVEEFSKAVSIDPTLSAAYIRLADAHIRLEELDEARRILTNGLEACPHDAYRLHPRLAWLSLAEGNNELAYEELERVLKTADDSPSCYYAAARIALTLEPSTGFVVQELYDEDTEPLTATTDLEPGAELAVAIITRAVNDDPLPSRAHFHAADILFSVGDVDGAAEQLELSAQHAPSGSWYEDAPLELLHWRGHRQLTAGDYAAAADSFEQILAARPGDTRALYQLARCQQSLGDDEQARRVYEELTNQAPDDPRGYQGLAQLHARRGELQAAIANAETAVAKDPGDVGAQKSLLDFYISAHNHQRAQVLLDNLLQRQPDDPELELLSGRLSESRDDLVAAVDHYQRALSLGLSTPLAGRTHFTLARLYSRRAAAGTETAEAERFLELADEHRNEALGLSNTLTTL
ncbi:MAG: tetratricopeptide repeat protein [Candidatus Coatesbacteria bacterium]|nr:tetratricopeptide repeat protein [Candidatus Coatesbacteria bacterium]